MPKRKSNRPKANRKRVKTPIVPHSDVPEEYYFQIENFMAHFADETKISVNGYGKWKLYKTPDGDFAYFTKIKIQKWNIISMEDSIRNKFIEYGLTKVDLSFLESCLKDTLNSDIGLCEYLPSTI